MYRDCIYSWLSSSLFALALGLGAAACGDDGGGTTPDAQPAPDAAPEPGPTVTLVAGSFIGPESAQWDSARSVWYVSHFGQNVDLSGQTPDEPGYISRIAADGTVMDERWVSLDGDFIGIAVLGDKLYAARTPHLVEIDIATGEVVLIEIPNAGFLNDVAVGDNVVYLSDTISNIIYRYVPGGQPEVFSQDPALLGPNGLLVDGEQVLVATVGAFPPNGTGGLFALDAGGSATRIGELTGNLDGMEKVGDAYLVSEFDGTLYLVLPDGTTEVVADLSQAEFGLMSTADIGYDPDSGAVMIPDLAGNNVYLFTWPH